MSFQDWLPEPGASLPLRSCCPRCYAETGKCVAAVDSYARIGGCRECDKRRAERKFPWLDMPGYRCSGPTYDECDLCGEWRNTYMFWHRGWLTYGANEYPRYFYCWDCDTMLRL